MNKLEQLEKLSKEKANGHYMILKFTTSYRVAFGTMIVQGLYDHKLQIEDMPEGKTLDEAIEKCIKEDFNFLEHQGYGDINHNKWVELSSMTKEERSKWRKDISETFDQVFNNMKGIEF